MARTRTLALVLLVLQPTLQLALYSSEKPAAEPKPTAESKAATVQGEDENPFMSADSAANLETTQPVAPATAELPEAAKTAARSPRTAPVRRQAPSPATVYPGDSQATQSPSSGPAQPTPTMLQVTKASWDELKSNPRLMAMAQERATKLEVFSSLLEWLTNEMDANPAKKKFGEQSIVLLHQWKETEAKLNSFIKANGLKAAIWEYPPDKRMQLNDLMLERQRLYRNIQKVASTRQRNKKASPLAMHLGSPPTVMEQVNEFGYWEFLATDFEASGTKSSEPKSMRRR